MVNQLSARVMNLGGCVRFDKEETENTLRQSACIWKEHGTYHVNGFAPDHFWESFDRFKEAKKFYLSQVRKIKKETR